MNIIVLMNPIQPVVFGLLDRNALEAALQIKDELTGTQVYAISMGPLAAAEVLKECLYRGADFTALLADKVCADSAAASCTLKYVIEKIGVYDMILCAEHSIINEIARKLGINYIDSVSRIEKHDQGAQEICVVRSINGLTEKVRVKLPVLLGISEKAEALRPASAIKVMTYKNISPVPNASPMALWSAAAADIDKQCNNDSQSLAPRIDSISAASKARSIVYFDSSEQCVAQLIRELAARIKTERNIALQEAQIIAAGGYGVNSKRNFTLIHDLAAALGAELGASRAAIDAGFIGREYLVGHSGNTVRPDIYIACGISGAMHHRVGIDSSAIIIAINSDPTAPIFSFARYGIIGDLNEVIPRMITAIQA